MDEENKLPPASPANQAGPESLKVEEQNVLHQKSNSNVRDNSQSDCNMNSEPGKSSELNNLTTALKSLDVVNEISENRGKCLCVSASFSISTKSYSSCFLGGGVWVLSFFFLSFDASSLPVW